MDRHDNVEYQLSLGTSGKNKMQGPLSPNQGNPSSKKDKLGGDHSTASAEYEEKGDESRVLNKIKTGGIEGMVSHAHQTQKSQISPKNPQVEIVALNWKMKENRGEPGSGAKCGAQVNFESVKIGKSCFGLEFFVLSSVSGKVGESGSGSKSTAMSNEGVKVGESGSGALPRNPAAALPQVEAGAKAQGRHGRRFNLDQLPDEDLDLHKVPDEY